jgi:DNA polymerase-3 subunit delta'
VSPSGAHEILVRDIDGPVVAAATRTPFEARCRVFVVEQADQLGDEAANRMLKTLEEPAHYVHLILITDRLGEVMPTIRSRCQIVRFEGPSIEELVAELREGGVGPAAAAAYARLGLGGAGRARELASDDGAAIRAAAEGFARACVDGSLSDEPWAALMAAVRARGERTAAGLEAGKAADLELQSRRDRKRVETEWDEQIRRSRRRAETAGLDLALSLIALWLLDLAALAWGDPESVRNVDRLEVLRERSGHRTAGLLDAVTLVEETRTRLLLNVTEDLALEALAYRMERALAR